MSSEQCFYHYTSTAGANGIRNDGVLKSNNGVMLSTLKPEDHTRDDILRSIHGNSVPPKFKNRADNVVYVDGSTLQSCNLSQVNATLYKFPGDIRISVSDVRDKPACTNRGGCCWGQSTQGSSNGSVSGSSGSQQQIMSSAQCFFHYTRTAGANGIRQDGVLRSNNGVMLSTLKPEDYTRDDILRSIHGSSIPPKFRNRADNVVFVNVTALDASNLRQVSASLYKYSGDIKISASDVKDKPACTNRGGGSWGQSNQPTNGSTSGSSGSNNVPQTFYYYSNQITASQAKSLGYIPSSGSTSLTTLKPGNNFRSDILKAVYGRNYDRTEYATCADWCIKIDGSKLHSNKLKRKHNEVYEYPDHINVNSSDVMDKPKCNKGGMNPGGSGSGAQHEYLYHYTNAKGAEAIKVDKYLKKSGPSGAFGVGVYMTNLKPTDFFRDDILKNNYGGINSAFKGRADFVVRVKKSDLDKTKLKQVGPNITNDGNRQIFVYQDEVTVTNKSDVYDKPPCYRAK